MIDLQNLDEIKQLDPKDVYGSTGMLADQAQQIVDEYFNKDFFSDEYKNIRNIAICGMGGSAYGGHILTTLFQDRLKVPVTITSDYHLPAYVDNNTLVFVSSYSGSTEEILSCAEEAKAKGFKVAGFSSGGALGEFLKDQYPGFTFNPKNNPSGQPRLGTGYMLFGTIALFRNLGVLDISDEEVTQAINELRNNSESIKTKAQELAKSLEGFIPAIMSAEFLNGNAHVMRNQFNETSKSYATFNEIPELNHHMMEGLKNPSDMKMKALMLLSDHYSDRIKKRVELTKDVINQNNFEVLEYHAQGSTKVSQMLNVLSFGGYITVYLGLIYGLDPSLIPWVDYFKEKLKQ